MCAAPKKLEAPIIFTFLVLQHKFVKLQLEKFQPEAVVNGLHGRLKAVSEEKTLHEHSHTIPGVTASSFYRLKSRFSIRVSGIRFIQINDFIEWHSSKSPTNLG